MKILNIAPTSLPCNYGTAGAQKIAFEFDQIMSEKYEVFTIAHPDTDKSPFKGKVLPISLRDKKGVLDAIDWFKPDRTIVHMSRTSELAFVVKNGIPCVTVVHISPEIAGMMIFSWMELTAQGHAQSIDFYTVSNAHARRLSKAYQDTRNNVLKRQVESEYLVRTPDFVFDKSMIIHYVTDDLKCDVVPGDGTIACVSRIETGLPIDNFFFLNDALDADIKLITNRRTGLREQDVEMYKKYHAKYGWSFYPDLPRDKLVDEYRRSSASAIPCAIESSSCKAFESVALGVPPIIFDKNGSNGALEIPRTDSYAIIPSCRSKTEKKKYAAEAYEKVMSFDMNDRIRLAESTRSFYTKDRIIKQYEEMLDITHNEDNHS